MDMATVGFQWSSEWSPIHAHMGELTGFMMLGGEIIKEIWGRLRKNLSANMIMFH